MSGLSLRRAAPQDAELLSELYRKLPFNFKDPRFLEKGSLRKALEEERIVCFAAAKRGRTLAMLSLLSQKEHGLCKLHQMGGEDMAPGAVLRALVDFAVASIQETLKWADILYCTTRTVTWDEQRLTRDAGFKVLGIFPRAETHAPRAGKGESGFSGLTAIFLGDTLSRRRHSGFGLHPAIQPFFEIVRGQLGLEALPAASVQSAPATGECPTLELVQASNFVARRFQKVRERKSLSVNFYPFTEPNALIMDPDQRVEVFVNIIREIRFATVIGERVSLPVDPVTLCREIARILHENGVTYIEVINDAADAAGLECILRAGYAPCAYFPALKKHASQRRDYVVFARSWEPLPSSPEKADGFYARFLEEYGRLLGRGLETRP
jgi:hypothetical protein